MIVGIIQARTGASRLPKKVMLKIMGKTLLEHYVHRVSRSALLDEIVIATTRKPEDDVIIDEAEKLGVNSFRGSEHDLLERYYKCAQKYDATVVVRLTADDPFVDPEVVDRAVGIFLDNNVDFVNNHFDPTYPEGLDIEVYSMKALEKSWKEAMLLSEREHVFPYIQNHPEFFKTITFRQYRDLSYLRWTIDYDCDFQMTKRVYDHLYDGKKVFLQEDILELLEKHPEISRMNAHIRRKEGVNKTKAQDQVVRK